MADINILNSVDDDTNINTDCNTNIDNPVNYNTDSDVDNSSIDKSVDSNPSIVNSDDIGCNIDNKCTDSDKTDSTDSNINMVDGNKDIDKPNKYKGYDNLIPFDKRTEEEQRRIRINGGIKSGEARRKKKTMNEIAQAILAAKMDDTQIVDVLGTSQDLLEGDKSVAAVLTVRMVQEAGKGNYKAYEVLRDTAGYKPKDQLEVETVSDADRELFNNISKRLKPKEIG